MRDAVKYVRSETFKVALLRSQVLWDVTLCRWTSSSPDFCLHLERQVVHEAWRWRHYGLQLRRTPHAQQHSAPSRTLEPSARLEFPLSPTFPSASMWNIIVQLQCKEQSSLCIANVCVCVCVCVCRSASPRIIIPTLQTLLWLNRMLRGGGGKQYYAIQKTVEYL